MISISESMLESPSCSFNLNELVNCLKRILLALEAECSSIVNGAKSVSILNLDRIIPF